MALDIEGVLLQIGIAVTKDDTKELWAACPMHEARTGQPDHHPSWSINTETFAHHCFSCGYSGNLTTLFRDVTGSVPEDLDWEVTKQSVLTTLERQVEEPLPEGPQVTEWSLRHYADMPAKLLERRHLQRSAVDYFDIRWDPDTRCWVIPIRSIEGHLQGYQYRQKGNVINYPPGMEKATTLFGIHLFRHLNRITVVESPLDAVRFYQVGIDAVSTFGAAFSKEQVTLLARNFRTIMLAMDNDGPGIRSTFYLRKALERVGCVVLEFSYEGLAVKDPGDVQSDAALRNAWLASNSLIGSQEGT